MTQWPVRALAAIGGLAVVVAAAGGVYFVSMVRGGFSARDQPSALEVRLARATRSLGVPSRSKALPNPVKATPDVLAEARAHWADHCATCHANDGSGDTQIGKNLYPKAPDMRTAATQGLSDGELYYIIQNGIRLSGMPAWGERVDDDKDSWALVAFVRHLPQLAPDELKEMQHMNPKSPDEWREEQEEEEFLRGGEGTPAEPRPEHHHQH